MLATNKSGGRGYFGWRELAGSWRGVGFWVGVVGVRFVGWVCGDGGGLELDRAGQKHSTMGVGQKSVPSVFFSVADASADVHTAGVIRCLRSRLGEVRCVGLGGAKMAEAGCRLVQNPVDRSAMLGHALGQVGYYFRLLGEVKRFFEASRPDLVVVVDSPAWNFHVAKAARRRGIPVLYYIAPQLWAWGAWRSAKLRRSADRIACILPFEEGWFGERGISATYVGHPLFEGERQAGGDCWGGQAGGFPTVALLPGSRSHEIKRLWPAMVQISQRIVEAYPEARFRCAAVSEKVARELREQVRGGLAIDVQCGAVAAVTRGAALTVAASGTATLEVAGAGCPMIILYHVPGWQWHLIGRWLIKTKHLSLVNILAGRELVPEFMPLGSRTEEAGRVAVELLGDAGRREQIRRDLEGLTAPLRRGQASARVTEMIVEMLGGHG